MNGCECKIYKMILDLVSNDYVTWAFITLTKTYKYASLLV